jgi:type I restriction enzyme, S subunit
MSKKVRKSVPVLRFPEFEGDWQPQKLKNILMERNIQASEELPLYSLTIESGIVPKTERYERSFLVKNEEEAYKVVQPNDFAYNPMNLRFGALARHTETKAVKVSKYYNIFSVNPKADIVFADYLLTKSSSIRFYDSIAMGSLVEKKRVHFSDFLKSEFLLPSIAEQEKIASFLGAVDTRLTQLRRKHELLQTYKRSVMQKIFSQQIRFRCDCGKLFPDWEEKELKSIAIVNPSSNHLPDKFFYIDLERVTDGRLSEPEYIDKDNAPSRAQRVLQKGDILYQTVRPYQRNNLFFDLQGSYVASTGYAQLRSKGVKRFLYYLVYSNGFVDEVISRCTGTSYPAINSSDLAGISVFIPESTEEQEKIADFLTAIDNKIEAIAQQIELTEQFKKGLLQKMFV